MNYSVEMTADAARQQVCGVFMHNPRGDNA